MRDILKTITIQSLSQYIEFVTSLPEETLYRGENALFEQHRSDVFRMIDCEDGERCLDFPKMLKQFWDETSYKLSGKEKTCFVAFAQHHGLPTNLLDVTKSPLVALFFACQPNGRKQLLERNHATPQEIARIFDGEDLQKLFLHYYEDWGYVYTSDLYIDTTDLIEKLNGDNFIDHYFLAEEDNLLEILPLIQEFKNKHPDAFVKLWGELSHIIGHTTEAFVETNNPDVAKLFKLFTAKNNRLNHKNINKFLTNKFCNIEYCLDNFDIDIVNYVYTIAFYIDLEKYLGDDPEFIAYLPQLLYRPTITFERGINQSGAFFYQSYFTYRNSSFSHRRDYISIALQCMDFSPTILQIQNKEKILQDLDRIGINQMSIWGDFDHIAAYIKKKYSAKEKLLIPK